MPFLVAPIVRVGAHHSESRAATLVGLGPEINRKLEHKARGRGLKPETLASSVYIKKSPLLSNKEQGVKAFTTACPEG